MQLESANRFKKHPAAVKTQSLEELYEVMRNPRVKAAFFIAPHPNERDFAMCAWEQLLSFSDFHLRWNPDAPLKKRMMCRSDIIEKRVPENRRAIVRRAFAAACEDASNFEEALKKSHFPAQFDARIGRDTIQ